MKYRSILPGVRVRQIDIPRMVGDLAYSGKNFSVSQSEFSIRAEGVGDFYAGHGREVEYCMAPVADREWVRLYLNGQVLVALLHQRKIINFHASSFAHNGFGIMVLGDTGSGKSSLTASFVMNGADFLTDDLTAVIFRESKSVIWPLGGAIRVREDTVKCLADEKSVITEAEPGSGKHYLHVSHTTPGKHTLDVIINIETGSVTSPKFSEMEPSEKFSKLRSGICMWEILAGMPETETAYLKQLLEIIRRAHFVRVVRPAVIGIVDLHDAVKEYLERKGDD